MNIDAMYCCALRLFLINLRIVSKVKGYSHKFPSLKLYTKLNKIIKVSCV